MASNKIFCLLFSLSLFSVIVASSSLQQGVQNSGIAGRSSGGQKLFSHSGVRQSNQSVQLQSHGNYVVLDNGILQVNLSNPQGMVIGIQYNGIENLVEVLNEDDDRGYWDIEWTGKGTVGKKGELDRLEGTSFKVIVQNEEQVEISFTRLWNTSLEGKAVPLNIDKRFIMLRGSSGFYTYAIYEHLQGMPDFDLDNSRISFKLRKDIFNYMAMSDQRQRYMPLPDDRKPPRGQVLAYPEAVVLVHPIEPQFQGEVDDKYEYSIESKALKVHGWVSIDRTVGFWQITPSYEFRSGGPLKQLIASHVGPTSLTVVHSTHYAGANMILKIGASELWKKVYGPVFIHLNSFSGAGSPSSLWEAAKNETLKNARSWPYDFPASEDYPKLHQRGTVTGRLLVLDSNVKIPGSGAYVGLAAPGDVGSWQIETKGYQFWTQADKNGNFTINGVRSGDYNLYAWVSGLIGDYKYDSPISISPGDNKVVGELVYQPPRNGPTLWEIGFPDRSAAEFYVPAPNPRYVNKLYLNQDRYRQYGLWERYTELYPKEDLVYTVGSSDFKRDWFFAQVTRNKGNSTYEGTTWQIRFNLVGANKKETYKLRLALATANNAELQVRINDPNPSHFLFTTGMIGKDNTIARHGIHGLYRLFSVDIPGSQLLNGNNTIFLTQANGASPFQGVMYDYLRLEGPPSSN